MIETDKSRILFRGKTFRAFKYSYTHEGNEIEILIKPSYLRGRVFYFGRQSFPLRRDYGEIAIYSNVYRRCKKISKKSERIDVAKKLFEEIIKNSEECMEDDFREGDERRR